ncbi:LysR family transcriptional regulator [Acuticoccus sp. M5D2P5]|uniref:LysR family transcriptional regulator n=1 Tax=Acuticoccus kalidii TaxID=2910977 RepID=UPI001F1B756F|nr:LysR family transcriptional regulator [Acuticoccus kalidii]MCF3934575.1 LysR family transcriptional regulator [Acuticoccus kalidii]
MKSANLDPELLRAFVAVAEQRSFTRAAGRLNRTQSAVSLQVRRLEQRIDVALFERSTAHVRLTAAGEGFLLDARRILALGEEALARLSPQRVVGRVRLGVMEDYGAAVLPGVIAAIATRFPLVEIEMEIGLTRRFLKGLGTRFDAVLAMHPEGVEEGDFICRERPVWVAAPDRAVEERDPLPVALSHPDCLFREWAIEALTASGTAWRLAFVSPSLAAVEAIVRQGLAVTIVKEGMMPAGLRRIEPPGLPPLPGAEIRFHRAPSLGPNDRLIVDAVADRLRAAWPGGGEVRTM